MVHGVCDAAAVFAELLIGLNAGAGRNFALQPFGEGGLLGNFAGSLEAGHDGGGVVAFGVGEVAEIEGGLDGRVGRGEVDTAAGAGTGDVGGHAEGVDGRVVAKTKSFVRNLWS